MRGLLVLLLAACEGSGIGADGGSANDGRVEDRDAAVVDADAAMDAARLDAGADTSVDAATDAASSEDASDAAFDAAREIPSDAAIVAQGYLGRSLVSCDDGRTWAYENAGAPGSCGGTDCLHHATSPQGLGFGGGSWFRAEGWGANPGRIFVSPGGREWRQVFETDRRPLGGFAVDGEWLIAIEHSRVYRSSDEGVTWTRTDGVRENPRRLETIELTSGPVLAAIYAGAFAIFAVSTDAGASWNVPDREDPAEWPAGCQSMRRMRGFHGAGTTLVATSLEAFCVTSDFGRTYRSLEPPFSPTSNVVQHDGIIWSYSSGAAHRTTDGFDWDAAPLEGPDGMVIREVVVTPTGAFVATDEGRDDDHDFYRSEDGIRWEHAGNYPGHAVQRFAVGRSELCADE
ncbi:MAG: hypothetical protein AAGE52_24990 [Myxococcota bacterium]